MSQLTRPIQHLRSLGPSKRLNCGTRLWVRVCVETAFKLGIRSTDAMAPKYGQQHWPPTDAGPYGHSGSNSMNSQQLPYDPNDPVLGTDMTQGEWDQLRELMRKAEAGGKMNELLTVHKKEVKNAPMNRPYPPDDEWQECEEGHTPEKPAGAPKSFGPASASGNSPAPAATGKAPAGALWPEACSDALESTTYGSSKEFAARGKLWVS